MPSEIVWLPEASRDVKRLRDFIKSENPKAAQRAAKRIIEGVNTLKNHPESGVPLEDLSNYRELILTFGSGEYIVRYRLATENTAVIIRVRHSKEAGF